MYNDYLDFKKFQSTPSVWRETILHSPHTSDQLFQSTPSVWRETDDRLAGRLAYDISIHSLRVEGDNPRAGIILEYLISIHSLRVEGDEADLSEADLSGAFQSTPSVWRETSSASSRRSTSAISIHSLRVEGDHAVFLLVSLLAISIHSLRVEGDGFLRRRLFLRSLFQSTPSVWRETVRRLLRPAPTPDFNPLPPCGGRPHKR